MDSKVYGMDSAMSFGEKEEVMPLSNDQRMALSAHVTRDRIEVMLDRLIALKEQAQRKASYYPTISERQVEATRLAAAKAVRSSLAAIDHLDEMIKLDQALMNESQNSHDYFNYDLFGEQIDVVGLDERELVGDPEAVGNISPPSLFDDLTDQAA